MIDNHKETVYARIKESMTTKLTSVGILLTALFALTAVVVAARPAETATLTAPGTTRTLLLPPAADASPVISLGTATDPGTGKVVEGFAIIHRRDGEARGSGGAKAGGACYTYLAKGAKWRSVEPWLINPTNGDGLDGPMVASLLTSGVDKWEDAADGVVGNATGVDVLGSGAITTSVLAADTSAPDNQNEVYFADISDPSAIAVTIVWGFFGGPPAARELVEWDQVYDDVTFDWSTEAAGVAGKMDVDNITTHELGHSVGLGDLYNSCTEETMYGYSAYAETKKRNLNAGDIAGTNALY